jgi:DNA-directed RNA polymerase subunit L
LIPEDMELNILEDSPHKLVFEMKGIDHTLANIIQKELWNDSDVKVSGYNISHPLVGVPKFIIETSKKKARDVLADTVKRLKKQNADFAKEFAKI